MVRIAFLEAVHIYGGDTARQCALASLVDAEWTVRCTAAEVLCAVPPCTSASPVIEKHLDDPEPIVRRTLAEALGVMGNTASVRVLESKLASETSSQARLGMVGALYMLGQTNRLSEILTFLADDDYEVRCAAARQLGVLFTMTKNDHVCRALGRLFAKDQSVPVREAVAEAMSQIACPKPTDIL